MRATRRAILWIAAAGLLGSLAWLLLGPSGPWATKRPRYVFVNETENHAHDTALKMSLKLAEKRSGIENGLILLKGLPAGATIEETAEALFRRWQIGRDRGGRGILYVYAEEENRFKIEVSYALEGVFPDLLCHRLEQAAQTYLLSEIPQDFLSELLITMNIEGQETRREAPLGFEPPAWLSPRMLSGGAGVAARSYRPTLEDYLEAVRALPEEDAAAFRPSPDPSESAKLYLASLELGLGDPRLPLLTEGSQIFRAVVPRSQAQQRRVMDYYQKAMPYDLRRHDDLAVAVFRPGVANLPIVLRRSRDGLWYVDEPKSWTWFHRWEDQNDFFPKYDDLPLGSALRQTGHPNADRPIYRGRVPTPRPRPYPFSLIQAVAELEAKARADDRNPEWPARLGEVYLFEMNWISRAIESFDQAARLDATRLEYHWRLYDLYINHSEVEKALSELRLLVERSPEDAEAKQWLEWYTAAYTFAPGEFP